MRKTNFTAWLLAGTAFISVLAQTGLAGVQVWRLYGGSALQPTDAAILKVVQGVSNLWRVNGQGPFWGFGSGVVLHLLPGTYTLSCKFEKGEQRAIRPIELRFNAQPSHEYVLLTPEEFGAWHPVVVDVSANVSYYATKASGQSHEINSGKIRFWAPSQNEHPRTLIQDGVPLEALTAKFPPEANISASSPEAKVMVIKPLATAHKYIFSSLEIQGAKAMPEQYLELLRWTSEEELFYENLFAAEGETPTRSISVIVTDFKLRTDSTRKLLGFFAGSDKIVATVTVTDIPSGNLVTQQKVEISNLAAGGTAETLAETFASRLYKLLVALPD